MNQDSRFSLSWESYKSSICDGLSSLQQNGEFVDMTLAADGHYVKVHQVIMALASPYIKELISAARCSHPVIFLNKISHQTLYGLLEYIYCGEVLVPIEQLKALVEVAKELHIKGLENMNIETMDPEPPEDIQEDSTDDKVCYFEVVSADNDTSFSVSRPNKEATQSQYEEWSDCNKDNNVTTITNVKIIQSDNEAETEHEKYPGNTDIMNPRVIKNIENTNVMQYTVSNQGSLQMILNRFVYYLKHTNRDRSRQWRCVDYVTRLKCPAVVFTQNEMVLQRISSHTHPFHDRKILKKAQHNAIFTAIHEAENEGKSRKNCLKINVDE